MNPLGAGTAVITFLETQVPMTVRTRFRVGAGISLLLLGLVASACGPKKEVVPQGMLEADKFLYERGQELLSNKKWYQAREYFQQIVENYPQSTYRPDAKLGLGDTYIGENTTESLILAQNEFKEFLTFYPTNARADYAQYRVGFAHFKQMRAPERDQTETREAIAEWTAFIERYPNSALSGEVQARLREAKDRLGDSEYSVGVFYYRVKWYPGAVDRFKALLANDSGYTRRDAVYYHMAESMLALSRPAEALPYFDTLVQEFAESEYLERATKRVAELKAAADAAAKK
ncbi:MAG: outer membrane protein assembly factor BamD [Vicinamibacterales bacterium]|nr:outer membrane protein assembly factor BamD [Vicinamibacterales bacterium]